MSVTFQGSGGSEDWEAKLVVGADGAFSAMRRQCLDDGPPVLAVSPASRALPPAWPGRAAPNGRAGAAELSW